MPAKRILSKVSPSRKWLSSCATKPSSSSRVSACKAPSVTTTTQSWGCQPAANALTSCTRGNTNTSGDGILAARLCSCTMLSNCCCANSRSLSKTGLAPMRCANSNPPRPSWLDSNHHPPKTKRSTTEVLVATNERGNEKPPNQLKGQASIAKASAALTTTTTITTKMAKTPSSQRERDRARC